MVFVRGSEHPRSQSSDALYKISYVLGSGFLVEAPQDSFWGGEPSWPAGTERLVGRGGVTSSHMALSSKALPATLA